MTAAPLPGARDVDLYPPIPPPGYAYPFEHARMVDRAFAAVIDLVVLLLITIVIALPLGLLTAWALLFGGAVAGVVGLLWGPFSFLLFAVFVLYFTYFESTSGRTIGKRFMGIRVVDLRTGQPPDLGRSLIRNVLRMIDWLPFLYLVGFTVAILTSRRQRVGDILAETMVATG